MILVLIPKGNTYTRGIGLLEWMWKVGEKTTDTNLRAIVCLHDVLHEFRAGMGTGMATLEMNLDHELQLRTPPENSRGIRLRPPHVQATDSVMGLERGRHPPKRVSRPTLQSNLGEYSGKTNITQPLQPGSGKRVE